MGKYSSKLYHKGASRHSSVIGGVLTIAFALVFITYSITELISVFKRTNINVTEREHFAQEVYTRNRTVKVGELSDLFVLTF
jgi:hypothetical protein